MDTHLSYIYITTYFYIVNRAVLPLDRDYEGHDISLLSSIEDNEDLAKSRNSIAPSIFFEDDEFSEI